MLRNCLIVVSFLVMAMLAVAQEQATPEAVTIDVALVKGRPQQNLVDVKTGRHFVWYDRDGWHLRTAAKKGRATVTFEGTIRIEGGKFGKLRPVGLDKHDQWAVNPERTEIRYVLKTSGSFDGFDFDIRHAEAEAQVTYDLTIGMQKNRWPKRIYLGKDGQHPESTVFRFPVDPDAVAPTE